MNPALLYDFRRTLSSKSVLVSVLMALLFVGVFVATISAAEHPPPSNLINSSGVCFRDSDGYHLLAYSFNNFGQPLSRVKVQFFISEASQASRILNPMLRSGLSASTLMEDMTVLAWFVANKGFSGSGKLSV